jgi:hypothetical protein
MHRAIRLNVRDFAPPYAGPIIRPQRNQPVLVILCFIPAGFDGNQDDLIGDANNAE